MSDITKCVNNECELRMGCWRFLAPGNPHFQSNAEFGTGGICKYIIPVDITIPSRKED